MEVTSWAVLLKRTSKDSGEEVEQVDNKQMLIKYM